MAGTFAPDGRTGYLMLSAWNAGQTLSEISATFGIPSAYVAATILSLGGSGAFTPVSYVGL
jgi:hypothetical protein